MKPAQAAEHLGIGRSTVTTWTSGEFKQYFTPNAQGGDGRPRSLSELDLRILHLIDQRKKSNVASDAIHEELRKLRDGGWEDIPPVESPASAVRFPVVPTVAAEAALNAERRALLREIAMLQETIDKAERRAEKERERNEPLVREIGGLKAKIARLEVIVELYESGRLKPSE